MTFAENLNRLCRERGTSLTAIVKQVKGSSSFTTAINKCSLPKEDEMIKMAELLHCLVADFLWMTSLLSRTLNLKMRMKKISSEFIVHFREELNMSL